MTRLALCMRTQTWNFEHYLLNAYVLYMEQLCFYSPCRFDTKFMSVCFSVFAFCWTLRSASWKPKHSSFCFVLSFRSGLRVDRSVFSELEAFWQLRYKRSFFRYLISKRSLFDRFVPWPISSHESNSIQQG